MSKLTKNKIGEMLNEYSVGRFSSLSDNKIKKIDKKNNLPLECDQDEFKKYEKINTLFGKELDFVYYLVSLCEKECSLRTQPIFSKDLISHLSLKPSHVRNIISRLNKKNILSIVLFNNGKHASRIFEFDKEIYSIIVNRKNKKTQVSSEDVEGEKEIEDNKKNPFDVDVSNIDFSSMEEYGFNTSHLIQIYREYDDKPDFRLSSDIIQDSIDAMAFDLKHNNVIKDFKNSPSVVLLSLLKKGKPYSSKTPEKFLSPQAEAMKRYIEIKSKEQKEKKELDDQLKQIAMKDWFDGISESELMEFYVEPESGSELGSLSDKVQATFKKRNALKNAKEYFEVEFWPIKRKEILLKNTDIETTVENG